MTESYMTFTKYCTELYRSKMDESALMEQFNQKTESKLETINHQYAYAIWYILNNEPSLYFNKGSYNKTTDKLMDQTISTDVLIHFHRAFKNYRQLTEMIQDFEDTKFNAQSKNKLYRIPTYVSLIDDCLTPLFKAAALLLGKTDQMSLTELCSHLKDNQLGSLAYKVDAPIIEAIHQGDFMSYSEGNLLGFNTIKNDCVLLKSFTCKEFDEMIVNLYDNCSGILLGFAQILSQSGASLASTELESNLRVAFDELALKLSLPNIACLGFNETSLEHAQLNITMKVTESDPNFLICTAIEVVAQVFETYPGYHRYFVTFEHDRLDVAFVRIRVEEIAAFLEDYTQLSHHIEQMLNRGDIQISNPSTEKIDLQEIASHQYLNLKGDDYTVHITGNKSTKNKKRLEAHLYVGDLEDKSEIEHTIKKAIDWAKKVKTPPLSKVQTKNGAMEADSIYLNVYRHDKRQDKTVSTTNDNFICFVEYNLDGRSTLKNGGLTDSTWNKLFKEPNGFLTTAWRDQKYQVNKTQKIGRNDPCPCGSNIKYKKCHGK